MSNQNGYEEDQEDMESKPAYNSFVLFFVIIWVILGLMGLLFSVVCFAYEGSFMENWTGFITAIVLGPFYWIYYAFSDPTYCSSGKHTDHQLQQEITIISTPRKKTIPFASSSRGKEKILVSKSKIRSKK